MTSKNAAPSPDRFRADPDTCIVCGACVRDCVAGIIHIADGLPRVTAEDHENCIGCQHCLTICPTGAAAVMQKAPGDSPPVGSLDPEALSLFMRSRRSIREFAPGGVDPDVLDRVLSGTAHAPTAVNVRARRFTVVLDPAVLAEFRDRACRLLAVSRDRLPAEAAWLSDVAVEWLEQGRDVIFRTAPHFIVVTMAPEARAPQVDAVIALSYFELLAQASGIATVWCGMIDTALRYLPELRAPLGIPDDHSIGYAMLFGLPGIHYARGAQYRPEDLVVLDALRA